MIALGIVQAVDSDGVYVLLPGSKGQVRGPYETVQSVAAGERVLVVTTDDGDSVVVGLAAASTPRTLPATSTDNAVARFDGSSGRVQGSSVAIDDSGNIAAGPSVSIDAPKDTANADVVFRAGGVNRWTLRRSADTETGSGNAGSNFALVRRSDAGSQLSLPIIVWRATGKVTLGDVGTTAGLEFGASGPTITSGTGAPSHSAPNASLYLRTDGGAGTTLYIRESGSWVAK